jgi:hypothetical protein
MEIKMNELNTEWKKWKDIEIEAQTKRREIEVIALAQNKLEGFKITKSYTKTWNQAALLDIANTTNFPVHSYFETEYKPISSALKEVPEELKVALTIKENKPTFALKETKGEK